MSSYATPQTPIRRHLLGLFSVVCLGIGIALAIWPPQAGSGEFVQGSSIKSGLVLFAAWLAFPQLERLPSWMFGTLIAFLLAVAIRPRIVLMLLRISVFFLPILILIWVLRPKVRRGAPP